ncbi:MAG: CDC27 family protein, partial [Bacteroidetes bacterium]|nr:CDC27 family protein [Bacteroidota bacterium]
MTPHKAIYFLISFYWFLGTTVQMLAQANKADSMGETRPIRMAVMPFCNESGDPDAEIAPDPEELYQYILGTLKGLYACQKPVVWVTDTPNGQSVLENKLDSTGRCGVTPEGGICANIGADLLIKGEFITNEYGVAEIYYSFENCEGIYSARIEYLTSQPLRVNMNHKKQAYRMISEAIQKDLQHFLQCEKGVSPLDADSVVQEGISMYSGADTNALNYLRAIDLMEKVLKTQPDHPESLYYIGLAYFSLEEYERAFSCFQKAGDIYESNTYSQFCDLESKPALWYNSSLKRRKWWNQLRDDWKNVFRVKVWNMEGEKEPTDEQLSTLFSETSLSFDDYPLPDLSGLEVLTNL